MRKIQGNKEKKKNEGVHGKGITILNYWILKYRMVRHCEEFFCSSEKRRGNPEFQKDSSFCFWIASFLAMTKTKKFLSKT